LLSLHIPYCCSSTGQTINRFSSALLVLLVIYSGPDLFAQRSGKTYHEDLSANRPKFQVPADSIAKIVNQDTVHEVVTPTRNVNDRVDAVLDSIDRINLTKKFVDGYTLQVYAGQKREDAMNAKQKVMTDTPELIPNLHYIQPKFRVTIGTYYTKLEAQKDLMRVKSIFPNAILVPEKVQIR
jgi:hypothetical protein